MKKSSAIALKSLKDAVFIFDSESANNKIKLLTECSSIIFESHRYIQTYHSCLLFLIAYPENQTLLSFAQQEMLRLSSSIKKLQKKEKHLLERSGLPFAETQGAYSFTLSKWLLEMYPNQVSLHSVDESGVHPKNILKDVFSEMEFDLTANEGLNSMQWMQQAFGTKNKTKMLFSLIDCINKLEASLSLKEYLFESLKIYLSLQPTTAILSKGFGNFEVQNYFYHSNGLLKKFNESDLLNKKLPSPTALNDAEKNTIIEKARIALFLLNRETDPITYCEPNGLLFYELEHGISIALFSMNPKRRMPIDSYIGFMMFKNGHPMAYGGGWLFAKHSLIGLNIFETYRGGESAFVFCQLLRTYKQNFDVTSFEVEPYQFGKNNPEGIKSGAFWFYYRFGFRPVDSDLKKLAQTEYQKIQANKAYRSSYETLKQFTNSNLVVTFGENNSQIDVSTFSQFITHHINLNFEGNRVSAEKFCVAQLKKNLGVEVQQLSQSEKIGFNKLLLFVGFCLNTVNLKAPVKNELKKLLFEKGNSEFDYIKICNQIRFKDFYSANFIDYLESFKL